MAVPKMRFQRLGGSCQPVIESSGDLALMLELDEALWAASSAPIDALVCDREFLEDVDDDFNGRIRTDELKRAISWLLANLKDKSGIDSKSKTLKLDAIDSSSPDGAALLAAAKLALEGLGLKEASEINLEQMRARRKALSGSLRKGGGVIPPDMIGDPELARFIKSLMEGSSGPDSGGKDGVDLALLDRFLKEAKPHMEWLAEADIPEGAASTPLMPFGRDTHAAYNVVSGLRPKVDAFFMACEALAACSDAKDRFKGKFAGDASRSIDPMDGEEMGRFLEGAAISEPSPGGSLNLLSGVNPLWRERLEALARDVLPRIGAGPETLRKEDWSKLKATLEPYEAWLRRKRAGLFDKLDPQRTAACLQGDAPAKLRRLVEEDFALAREMSGCDTVRKLILYQATMLEFANNYVSFTRLFNPNVDSMLQAGRLVMDGRHFTLTSKIQSVEEHKSIASRCEICVMYLSLSTGPKDKLRSMLVAVAVTSGLMRNLFIGKGGVFFTPDGTAWDAKVVDFIQQPVSVSEALRMPFYKIGEFLGRQAERFFSVKGKEIETGIEKGVIQSPVQQSAQAPALSGSMLLMGGGVGIAALGSSFAFMANSLKDVSPRNVLAVLAGILVVFGGPVVTVSLVKLWRRNIAVFLEAGGWAVNHQMRLTRKMGLIFTHSPKMPEGSSVKGRDLVNSFFRSLEFSGRRPGWLLRAFGALLAFCAGFAIGAWIYFKALSRFIPSN